MSGRLPISATGTSGTVTFTGDVVQIRRTGLFGMLRQFSGVGRGNKDIPVSAITGIRLEPGSFSYRPFFQVVHSGASETQGGGEDVAKDDNTVFFAKKSMPEFEQLRDLIMAAIAAKKAPAAAAPSESLADTLAKLGALRDSGVLTQQEFEAKKADLLTRL